MAQEATAEPGSSRLIAPDACTTAPRPAAEVATILALDDDGVPPPAVTRLTPPLGDLADAATSAAITAAVEQIIACFNAGDIARTAALMTEAGGRRAFWGLTITAEQRALLPDGRVAAFVVLKEPILPPGGPETLLFLFAKQDSRWLFDDLIDFSIVPAGPATATPAS